MNAPHAVRAALAGFRRTPLLLALSVVAIALSLFVVGLFALTAHNIGRQLTALEERVEVIAYLRDDAGAADVEAAIQQLRAAAPVQSVRYVSREDALGEFLVDMSEYRDVVADLESNPLPASLELRMRPGHRDTHAVERLAQHVLGYPVVEDVRFGRDWVQKIVSLRRIAGGATAIIGGAFAAVAAIIIATAVRIAVYARREEISIMHLVGATDGFVQRPFLIEGLLAGLIGGALAVGLTWAAYRLVTATLWQIAWLPPVWALVGIMAGAALGLLSSGVAVRRHLRTIVP